MIPFARRAIVVAGITAVFASQFSHVRATNSSGYDEWLYLALASRGIINFPYQNRPLVLLWHLPPALLAPGSLAAFYAAHAFYLLLAGVMAFALVRRAVPGAPLLAFVAGALATVWAPMDHARLLTVTLAGYAGWTFATLLAGLLFVESCIRSSRTLVLLSAGIAAASVRGAEATLPLLAAGPIIVWFAKRRVARAFIPWMVAWGAALVAAAGWAIVPLLRGGAAVSYQTGLLGLDPHPLSVLARLVRQLGFHLLPAITTPPATVAVPAALLSAAVFAAACAATARVYRSDDTPLTARAALRAAALGLFLACLGYAPFTLTAALPNPIRTQFLSTPGVALFLAAVISAVAGRAGRWRVPMVALLGGWLAAAGTAHTLRMQRDWDRFGSFGAQATALRQLVGAAPALAPNTLVLLLDDAPVFPATFTFEHAIEYFYGPGVTGHALGAAEFLYGCRRIEQGFACEPWPVIREPWGVAPSVHHFDEIVVARRRAGRLEVSAEWPPELGALPPGARYSPAARILHDPVRLRERRMLYAGG